MKRTLYILTTTFFVTIALCVIADIWETELDVVGTPAITGNHDVIYTKYTDQDGNERWDPDDLTIEINLDADFDGAGLGIAVITWAQIANDTFSNETRAEKLIGDKRYLLGKRYRCKKRWLLWWR